MNDQHPEHGKVILSTVYYNGAAKTQKTEYEVSVYSTRQDILKEVIEAMTVLTKGTSNKLDMTVQVDERDRYRLVKRWQV